MKSTLEVSHFSRRITSRRADLELFGAQVLDGFRCRCLFWHGGRLQGAANPSRLVEGSNTCILARFGRVVKAGREASESQSR
jgi:hypothetical protein